MARSAGALWWLAAATAALTYLVIVAGAVVRVTGSGLGCPDWPTCHQGLVPPAEASAVIEYTHRFLVGPLILAVPALAWFARRERTIVLPALLLPFLLLIQIVLGAVVVRLELPPLAVLVHLGFAMLILGGLVWVAAQAGPAPSVRGPTAAAHHYPRLLVATAAAVYFLVLTGAYTRATGASWACVGFPGCDVPVAAVQALEAAQPSGGPGLVQIHLFHRFVAYLTSVLIVAAAAETWRLRRHVPALRRTATLLVGVLAVQVLVGIGTVSFGLPTVLRGAHVAGAAAVWAASVLLLGLSLRVEARGATGAGDPRRSAGEARSATTGPRREMAPVGAAGWTALTRVAEPAGGEAPVRPVVSAGAKARAYLSLTKPRVILLLEVPTLAAMLIAGPGWPSPLLVVATLLGGALAAGGAAAINCYLDRDIDAMMGDRTRKRAIPAGLVSPGEALTFGLVLAVASFVVLAIFANWLAAFLAQAALLFYVFVYTRWLKRTTPSNIVIGGAAGAIPPLVGWAAVTGEIGPPAWLLFAVIFFWTPPHFWALSLMIKQHYERARVPMLPVVRGDAETRRQIVLYAVQMIAVTLLLFAFRLSGLFYLLAALALGAVFLYYCGRLWREATTRAAGQLFRFSILYLWLLCIALVVDKHAFT